jgi:hypothetical protein
MHLLVFILVIFMLILAAGTAVLLVKTSLITLGMFGVSMVLLTMTLLFTIQWYKKPVLFPLIVLCSILIMVYGETVIRPHLQIEREKELLNAFDFEGKDISYFKIQKRSRVLVNLQARSTYPQVDLEGLFYLINRQVKQPRRQTWIIMPRTEFEKFPQSISGYLRLDRTAYRYSIESLPEAWFSLWRTEQLKKLIEDSRDWIALVQVLPYKIPG